MTTELRWFGSCPLPPAPCPLPPAPCPLPPAPEALLSMNVIVENPDIRLPFM